jgi:hypothetical protein
LVDHPLILARSVAGADRSVARLVSDHDVSGMAG